MKKKSIDVSASVRLNSYKIIDDTIESAIRYGYNRAHKYLENPNSESIIQEIHRSIMNDLCEILKFDDE